MQESPLQVVYQMLSKIIGFVWKKTPSFVRLRAIRSIQTKFTVSVAAVIFNEKDEVLLLEHLLRPFSSWGIPGGFIEGGEQPEPALRREIREETGLELANVKMIRVRTIKRHVEILFRAEGVGKAEVRSREITGVEWFAVEQMPADMSEAQKSLVRKVLRGEI